MSRYGTGQAVSVVSFIASSLGYIKEIQLAKFRLMALASVIILFLLSFCINSAAS